MTSDAKSTGVRQEGWLDKVGEGTVYSKNLGPYLHSRWREEVGKLHTHEVHVHLEG